MTSPPQWLARRPVFGWDVMSFAVTSLSVVAFGQWTVLPELCTFCFTTKQTNSLKKKSSSFLLHLVPSPPPCHPWHFSFVCLSLFYCWCFFLIVFLILFEFGFIFIFFFHLACYCTAVLMSWSVFSVTGKQLSLIKKKKKSWLNKANCAKNKSSQLELWAAAKSLQGAFPWPAWPEV